MREKIHEADYLLDLFCYVFSSAELGPRRIHSTAETCAPMATRLPSWIDNCCFNFVSRNGPHSSNVSRITIFRLGASAIDR